MKQSETKTTDSKASVKGGGIAKKANPSPTKRVVEKTTTTTVVTRELLIPTYTLTSRETTEYFTWLPGSTLKEPTPAAAECFSDYWQGTPEETPRSEGEYY